MVSFGTTYWFVYFIAALIAATGVALLLYFRNRQLSELSKSQVRLLMVLRFFSFFLIAFLLLSPFLRHLQRITANPVIIAAWDNSGSVISSGDSLAAATQIEEIRNRLNDELNENYRVVNYTFGESTGSDNNLHFSEKKSDYSEMLSTIADNHFNENIGALIVAGDGIYNEGRNPVNLTGNLNFPVYTIGLGDTTEIADARIRNIDVNRTAFTGNRFPVEVDLQFTKLAGELLELSVRQDGEELAGTVITPPNDDYFYSEQFILEAGDPGLKHYTISVQASDAENNTENNVVEFVINVLENKQKILILSDGPHPDIGAIRNTLEEQQIYEVSVFTEEPYPSNLNEFNLIVLNQLPTSGKSIAELVQISKQERLPVLYIVGQNMFIPQFNALAEAANIEPLAGSMEEAQATINPAYGTFSISESFREMLPQFPPLLVPFAEYNLEPGFTPVFYQKVQNIETARPLIATGTTDGRKTGYIFGEGIWKWRLFNYYSNQTHNQFNELINQLVQYLALRENEDNFIVEYSAVYDEIENIIFTAEVYNDAFEPVRDEEVTITIINENGEEFDFTFDTSGDHYRLNAGNLPVGDYSFTAEVTLGEETFTEIGNFTIVPVNIESIETSANHRMLFQLAANSGGRFYLPASVDEMTRDLTESNNLKPVVHFQESINELLNLRWWFFVLLLLLSVEWFLRKFWGVI